MLSEREHSSLMDECPRERRLATALGRNVRRLRTKAKINKKKFALMVDIGRPFLNKIEEGAADPRLSLIVKLAEALETTPEYLLADHGDESASCSPALRPNARSDERHLGDGRGEGMERTTDIRHARLD